MKRKHCSICKGLLPPDFQEIGICHRHQNISKEVRAIVRRQITGRSSQTSKVYDAMMNTPPVRPDGRRRRGSSLQDAFWVGYDGLRPIRFQKGSPAYAAYRAGRDYRKKNGDIHPRTARQT